MSDQEVIRDLAKNIGKIYTELGFSEVLGEVWVLLHFNGPMTQSELKKELKCGIGSVSQSLKILEKLGAVKVVGKQGRQRIYDMEESVSKIKKQKLEVALSLILIPIKNSLEDSLKRIKNKDNKQKLETLKSKFSKMEKFIKLIKAMSI